jgi:hypothetical protein
VAERMIEANGVELCTEPFGEPTDPPILFIMGTGASIREHTTTHVVHDAAHDCGGHASTRLRPPHGVTLLRRSTAVVDAVCVVRREKPVCGMYVQPPTGNDRVPADHIVKRGVMVRSPGFAESGDVAYADDLFARGLARVRGIRPVHDPVASGQQHR